MYIAMFVRLIVIVLIAIALLSSTACLFTNDQSCGQFLETVHGKVAVVAVAILAASQHLLCGLVIAIILVLLTNTHREGFTATEAQKKAVDEWWAKEELAIKDQEDLLEEPAVKLAYRQKICDPRFATNSSANQKALAAMTNEMTMTFPHGPCNPCSPASARCNFNISPGPGADQLQPSQRIKPQDTGKPNALQQFCRRELSI